MKKKNTEVGEGWKGGKESNKGCWEVKKVISKRIILNFLIFCFSKKYIIFSLNFDVYAPSTRDITYLCQLNN